MIKVKFTASPGKQFEIRREAFRRIHAALHEAGIQFASKSVTVQYPQSSAPAVSPQSLVPGQHAGQGSFPPADPAVAGAASSIIFDQPADPNAAKPAE